MRRRSKRGRPAKDRRRNRLKARKAPISQASPANLQDKLDQLTRELDDARQREAATSEVLKVINSSLGKLTPVFQAMLKQATSICDAKFGIVFRYEGGLFHPVASLDLPPALADFMDANTKGAIVALFIVIALFALAGLGGQFLH